VAVGRQKSMASVSNMPLSFGMRFVCRDAAVTEMGTKKTLLPARLSFHSTPVCVEIDTLCVVNPRSAGRLFGCFYLS
jgi:hypothetical protein